MQITLKLYGNLKRYAPQKTERAQLEIAAGMTVAALLARFGVPDSAVWMSVVNDAVVEYSTILQDGDVLEVFEPVGGGTSKKREDNTMYDLAVINGATVTVFGIAHTDESGLAKLEIKWDAANLWQPAELVRGPSPLTWTAWRWTGPALSPSRHTLSARTTNQRGKMQTRGQAITLPGGTFPNGTDQMHSIVLDFKA